MIWVIWDDIVHREIVMDDNDSLAEFYGPENVMAFSNVREALAADGRPDAIILDVGCLGLDWEEKATYDCRLLTDKFPGATMFVTSAVWEAVEASLEDGIIENAILLRWPNTTDIRRGKTLMKLWTEIMSQYGVKPK